jgi:hypothetical protein
MSSTESVVISSSNERILPNPNTKQLELELGFSSSDYSSSSSEDEIELKETASKKIRLSRSRSASIEKDTLEAALLKVLSSTKSSDEKLLEIHQMISKSPTKLKN